ncbi:hypothetical protein AAGC89_04450 [Proteus mirabilis]
MPSRKSQFSIHTAIDTFEAELSHRSDMPSHHRDRHVAETGRVEG